MLTQFAGEQFRLNCLFKPTGLSTLDPLTLDSHSTKTNAQLLMYTKPRQVIFEAIMMPSESGCNGIIPSTRQNNFRKSRLIWKRMWSLPLYGTYAWNISTPASKSSRFSLHRHCVNFHLKKLRSLCQIIVAERRHLNKLPCRTLANSHSTAK